MRADIKALQVFVDQMVGKAKFSYPARQGGKRPTKEFCTISLLNEYQESVPAQYEYSSTDTTITYRTRSLSRLRFRIGIVDTDGVASTKIMNGWTSNAMKALMHSTGYGFIRCYPISLEDAKLEKEWEPRQGMAVEMYVTRTYEETVDTIKSLVVSGSYISDTLDEFLLNIEVNE